MSTPTPASWKPLDPTQRRVLGVLIEKAMTTPAGYPMTVNAIVTGCNQKNNRDPLTTLDDTDVGNALLELGELGVVMEIDWMGRSNKYKHKAYEWLGVSKAELAVMAELLLRGTQQLGELRARADRMEPIADLAALKPVVDSLVQRRLVIELTPAGRGQMVTHGLGQPGERQAPVERAPSVESPAALIPTSPSKHFPATFPRLTTRRLVLREVADHDVLSVFEMESDPVAMRYWSKPPMRELAEARASVERAKTYFPSRSALRWSVTLPADDRMIGQVSLFNFSEQSGRAEIGYGLSRKHWSQGYMHEALMAVLDYAFGPLGLRRLEADIDPRNEASLRALERVGFAREGLLRERWQVGDEISDTALLGVLAREWKANRTH